MIGLWMVLACQPCPRGVCAVEGGAFQVEVPDGYEGGPALVYLHGYGGSAEESLADGSIVGAFLDAGVVVAAPVMEGTSWTIQSTSFGTGRDAMAFHDAIRAGLAERFGADTFYVAGFSLGASVAWDLGCRRSVAYAGIYSLSGDFWEPLPGCDGPPVAHVHRHGTEDRTYPIEGAEYRGNQQAHLDEAWAVLTARGACVEGAAGADGCTDWSCEGGVVLTQCRGAYGHRRPPGWADDAVERFGL